MSLFARYLTSLRTRVPLVTSLPVLTSSTPPPHPATPSAPTSNRPPVLLDIRDPSEYTASPPLPHALLLPRSHLEMQIERVIPDPNTEIFVMCAGGVRSVLVAHTLREMGYRNVKSVEGGMRMVGKR